VPDVAKVVDFGLVKAVDTGGDVGLTAADAITGTPLYMPPEAVRSPESVDARSDLYALGCVGYFLLAGSPVFEGDSVVSVLADHIHREPTPPSVRLGCPVPKDLEALILRCLAKDPAERPSNAAELATALSSCGDANGWTAAEARAWWSANASPREGGPAEAHAPAAATVTVDLSGRVAA
jgi:serine/threonine protein kinase